MNNEDYSFPVEQIALVDLIQEKCMIYKGLHWVVKKNSSGYPIVKRSLPENRHHQKWIGPKDLISDYTLFEGPATSIVKTDTGHLIALSARHVSDQATAIVRTDTQEILAVHYKKFNLVKHETVANAVRNAVNIADLTPNTILTLNIYEKGLLFRGTVKFPDIKVGFSDVGDYTHFELRFYSSYDNRWAFRIAFVGMRLVCKNGMVIPDIIATKTINVEDIDEIARSIKTGCEYFEIAAMTWWQYLQSNVSRDSAEEIFLQTLCQGRKSNVKSSRITELMYRYDIEQKDIGNNLWTVFNTATYWSTHVKESKYIKKPYIATINREKEVAEMLKSKIFMSHLIR